MRCRRNKQDVGLLPDLETLKQPVCCLVQSFGLLVFRRADGLVNVSENATQAGKTQSCREFRRQAMGLELRVVVEATPADVSADRLGGLASAWTHAGDGWDA